VLNAYLDKHGDRVLLPSWGPGYVLHDSNARKARTPRASAPPEGGPIQTAVEAALAKAHGGVNFAAPPPAAGRDPVWHMLDVAATSVLMGYRHDRVLRAPGVANDLKASWRLLGNTIQRAALEHVCAPFLDGLAELRDQTSND
jgi:hypothetical protein